MNGFKPNDRAVRALSLAIMQPTISGGDAAPFYRLHTLLRQLFPKLFAHASCETFGLSLLIHLPGRQSARPMVFLSHMDVVDAGDESRWTHAPFGGEIEGGYIYGRGAADMKGHMIALLTAAEDLLSEGWNPASDIYFAFSCDEELRGGSMEKLACILRDRGVKPLFVLDEGGSVFAPYVLTAESVAYVGVAEKGRLGFSLSCEGMYAMEKLSKAASRIARIHPKGRLCAPVLHQMLPAMIPLLNRRDRWCLRYHRFLGKRLIYRFSRTAAGYAITHTQLMLWKQQGDALMHEKPTLYYTAGVLPGDSTEEMLRRVRRILRSTDIALTVGCLEEPGSISPACGVAWDALVTAIQVHFPGKTIVPALLAGGTDARRMEALCPHIFRFSPFVFSAEEMSGVHGYDERISVENLSRGVSFFRQMLQS